MKTKLKIITWAYLILIGLKGFAADDYTSVTSNTTIPNRALMVRSQIKNQTNNNARHSQGYNGITYDASLGMLVFPDMASFKNTLILLTNNLKNFKFDNGNTANLLSLLNASTHGNELYDTLQSNSPLSDTVLITLLKGNHPHHKLKEILLNNIDFSEKVDSIYTNLNLEAVIKQEINSKRFIRAPYDPVLDAFESQFPGYVSHRTNLQNIEVAYLKTGADPAAAGNPFVTETLSRAMGTLFNANKEVKIGTSFLVILPKRDIEIKNEKVDILNYIRKNGNIPFNTALGNEPDNGFQKNSAPPLVDTNIVVTPTGGIVDQVNGCGGEVTIGQAGASGRFAFSFGDPKASHYWDFGDGYVSYKSNPTHIYRIRGNFIVTGIIYDSYGPCGGSGGSGTGTGSVNSSSGGNGNNNPLSCPQNLSGSFSASGSYETRSFSGISSGFTNPFNLDYYWSFGDNSYAHGNPINHTYSYPATYAVSVTITDNITGCSWTSNAQSITTTDPPPPPTACCTKGDKVKHTSIYCDHNHKFLHSLTIKGIVASTNGSSEVCGEVTQFHRILFGAIWWWQNATSGVNIGGTVYGQDNSNRTCGGTFARPVSGINTGPYVWNTIYNYYGDAHLYTSSGDVSSSGTAFTLAPYQTTDQLLSDCP